MSSLPWFRMWADAVDDEKLKILAFEDRWHFVAILCLKRKGILDVPNDANLDRKVAAKLGLAHREAQEVLDRLVDAGLVSPDWQPLGWERRQYESDVSTERVRKFREKRSGNVSETPSDNRLQITDTEKREEIGKRVSRAPTAKRLPEDFTLTDERKKLGEKEGINPEREFARFSDHWRSASGANARKHDWDAAWRNWCRKAADYVPRETIPTRTWRPTDEDSGTC